MSAHSVPPPSGDSRLTVSPTPIPSARTLEALWSEAR